MGTSDPTIWFPKSWRCVLVVVTLWLVVATVATPLLRAALGDDAVSAPSTLRGWLFAWVSTVVIYGFLFQNGYRSSIRQGRVRGASSIGGLRSVRPPRLDEVERLDVEDGLVGRLVVITATTTDGEVVRWRLDGPRRLRWGKDEHFDEHVALLRSRWREAIEVPQTSERQ